MLVAFGYIILAKQGFHSLSLKDKAAPSVCTIRMAVTSPALLADGVVHLPALVMVVMQLLREVSSFLH